MTSNNHGGGNSHFMTTTQTMIEQSFCTSNFTTDPAVDVAALEQMVTRFVGLLNDVDVLLADYEQRSPEPTAAADLQMAEQLKSSLQQFMKTRTEWENERQQQLAQLHKDQAQLAAAWQRVEAEERKVLSQRACDRKPVATKPVEELAVVSAIPRQMPGDTSVAGQNSSDAMLLQYQRLRREMQKHSQKSRR